MTLTRARRDLGMALYRSTVSHGRLRAGEVVEIPDHEVPLWAGPMGAGFLVPVDPPLVTEPAEAE